MDDFSEMIDDKARELRETFGADEANITHYQGTVSYNFEWWDDDRGAVDQLERARDLIENQFLPQQDPDDVDISVSNNLLRISLAYDYSDDDEENDEATTEDHEGESDE